MSTAKILNILSRSFHRAGELLQRNSVASQYRLEANVTCENSTSAFQACAHDGGIVFAILANGIYPYKSIVR